MARPKLTVYLDIISPFAYMAFYVTKVGWTCKEDTTENSPLVRGRGTAQHELS